MPSWPDVMAKPVNRGKRSDVELRHQGQAAPGEHREAAMKKTCDFCSGAGQISSFKGVSRFLLSQEECPECAGLGVVIAPDPEGTDDGPGHPAPGPEGDARPCH